MNLWFDTETYSDVPIKWGTYRYAAAAEVMLATYAFDDGPVHVWDLTNREPMPKDLFDAFENPRCTVTAHNAMFDRAVLTYSSNLRARIAIPRWRCTMVKALAHSMPGSLEKLGEILKLGDDEKKLKEGRDLIRLFCMPRPKNSKLRRATRITHPTEWARFVDYAKGDIEAMRRIDAKLPSWNYRDEELALWHLDQKINDRGFACDVEHAEAAIRAVAAEQKVLKERTQELTGYDGADAGVESATKRGKMLAHILCEYGVDLPDLKASTLERRIRDENLPWALRQLLEIRMLATTTSTTKYKALARGVSDDGRLRGTLQFNGASRTGRWAGRVFQPQNLPRPSKGFDGEVQEQVVEAIKLGILGDLYPSVMQATSDAIRGVIVAPPGKKLVVSDLSNIEGRKLAWLADEEWKLDAFRALDAGTGHDLYALAYAKAFHVTPESVMLDKKAGGSQRQVGKVMELALGYEGGVGAFVTFALVYGIDLEELAEIAYDGLPTLEREQARDFYKWVVEEKRPTFGLSERAFVTCDTFKRLWRNAHSHVVDLWRALEATCVAAVERPGNTMRVNALKVRRDGAWLRVQLPSGRALCYPNPRVGDDGKLSYMGVNQYTRQWCRIKTYGGKLAENVTQAASRDVLAGGMMRAEDQGYEIVLDVHDEIISETRDTDEFTAQGLGSIMATPPSWAPNIPLAAGGFTAYRYKKEG